MVHQIHIHIPISKIYRTWRRFKHTNVSPLLTYTDTKLCTTAPAQILRSNQQRCLHQQHTAPAAARVLVGGRNIQGKSENLQHQRETKIMHLTNIVHSTKNQDAPRQPRTHWSKPPLPQPMADTQYQSTQSILYTSAH